MRCCPYSKLFHFCPCRWNNCLRCPLVHASLRVQVHMNRCRYTLFLGCIRVLLSWKEWEILKVGVKEAVRAHDKVMWNESAHLLPCNKKTANKTAQWANLVAQSETENTHRPEAGYQTQDLLDLYRSWASLSSPSPFNLPTNSHREPWSQGCVDVCVCACVCARVHACHHGGIVLSNAEPRFTVEMCFF